MPEGVFAMVHGTSPEVGITLVTHPAIRAGASRARWAGRTLFDAAALRPEPIPVYAEMGSSNPVFLLPGAIPERGRGDREGLRGLGDAGLGPVLHESRPRLRRGLAARQRVSQSAGDLLAATPRARWSTPAIKAAYDPSVAEATRMQA